MTGMYDMNDALPETPLKEYWNEPNLRQGNGAVYNMPIGGDPSTPSVDTEDG